MDQTSGIAIELETGVPSYQVEDEEGRIHLLLQLPIDEVSENCCAFGGPIMLALTRGPFFEGALVEE